jgi:hypothetical protein
LSKLGSLDLFLRQRQHPLVPKDPTLHFDLPNIFPSLRTDEAIRAFEEKNNSEIEINPPLSFGLGSGIQQQIQTEPLKLANKESNSRKIDAKSDFRTIQYHQAPGLVYEIRVMNYRTLTYANWSDLIEPVRGNQEEALSLRSLDQGNLVPFPMLLHGKKVGGNNISVNGIKDWISCNKRAWKNQAYRKWISKVLLPFMDPSYSDSDSEDAANVLIDVAAHSRHSQQHALLKRKREEVLTVSDSTEPSYKFWIEKVLNECYADVNRREEILGMSKSQVIHYIKERVADKAIKRRFGMSSKFQQEWLEAMVNTPYKFPHGGPRICQFR